MPSPKASRLFHKALRVPPEKRDALVEKLCFGEPQLIQAVQELLRAHERAGKFLEKPASTELAGAIRDAPSSRAALSTGEKVAGFLIQKEIGRGATAVVYLATEIALGRQAAVKISADTGEEGALLASLDHENIVKVFSQTVLPDTRSRLLAMQYVEGPSFEEVLKQSEENGGAFLLVATIGMKLAEALAHAHGRGVLHLDIKPANVLFTAAGSPLLADFNVAVRSSSGKVRGGTAPYMSPEHQARLLGKESIVDARADLFSLGKLLLEWGERSGAFSSHAGRVFLEALTRCTAEKREDRYGTAAELASLFRYCLELHQLQARLPLSRSRLSWAQSLGPWLLAAEGLLPFLAALGLYRLQLTEWAPRRDLADLAPMLAAKDLLTWGPFSFGAMSALWLAAVAALFRLKERLRQAILLAPAVFFGGSFLLGWGVTLLYAGTSLGNFSFIPFVVVRRVTLQLALTYSVSSAFAFLLMEALCFGVLFPALWSSDAKGSDRLARERAITARALRITFSLAIGAPAIVALLGFFPFWPLRSPLPSLIFGLVATGSFIVTTAFFGPWLRSRDRS